MSLSDLASELLPREEEEILLMVALLSADAGTDVDEDMLAKVISWGREIRVKSVMLDAALSGRIAIRANDQGELTFASQDIVGECLKRTGKPWPFDETELRGDA